MSKSNRAKRKRPIRKQPPTLLILAGIALLLIAIFLVKSGDSASTASALESQLDEALAANRPTFVFLHSLDCIPCKAMMNTVAEVYPEFQDSVVLIDVDIYDQRNQSLMQRERLQSIPTLVFYDAQGARQVYIGAMPSDQFRETLQTLALEQ